jgi:hypothetical protein
MVGLSAFPNRGPVDETKSSQMSLGIVPSSLPASLSPRNTNVEPPILPTTQPQPQQPQQRQPIRQQQRRRLFAIAGSAFRYQFPANRRQLLDWGIDAASWIVEIVVYWLGPLLITLASSIICLMLYAYVTIILPMIIRKHGKEGMYGAAIICFHCTLVLYLLVQIVFNYYHCVVQKHSGPLYDRIVRELAETMDFPYPESPESLAHHRRNVSDLLKVRIRRQREEGGGIRAWMLQGPFEWGYCTHSNQAKPPRSHYDHVVKALVLNLDHYCPWMFNAGKRVAAAVVVVVSVVANFDGCKPHESFLSDVAFSPSSLFSCMYILQSAI